MAAARHFDTRAGAALNELPRVALEVHGGRTLTRRAGTGGAIVLPLQRDAIALFLVSRDGCASSAFVSGAAWATDASRLATTPASRVALTVAFADIEFLQ